MIFRPSRSDRGDDRFVNEKMLIFAVGAVLGIAGIASDTSWLVWTGIVVLAIGVVLRLLRARRG